MKIIDNIMEKINNRPSLEFFNTINEGDGSCGQLYYRVCHASAEAVVDDTCTPVVKVDEKGKFFIPLEDGNKFYVNKFQVKRLNRFRERVRGYSIER